VSELRYLMEKYLRENFNGTAHPHRVGVLNDFVEWIENREDSKVLTRYLNDKLAGTSLEGKARVVVEQ
jgi:hypothetical protein